MEPAILHPFYPMFSFHMCLFCALSLFTLCSKKVSANPFKVDLVATLWYLFGVPTLVNFKKNSRILHPGGELSSAHFVLRRSCSWILHAVYFSSYSCLTLTTSTHCQELMMSVGMLWQPVTTIHVAVKGHGAHVGLLCCSNRSSFSVSFRVGISFYCCPPFCCWISDIYNLRISSSLNSVQFDLTPWIWEFFQYSWRCYSGCILCHMFAGHAYTYVQ